LQFGTNKNKITVQLKIVLYVKAGSFLFAKTLIAKIVANQLPSAG